MANIEKRHSIDSNKLNGEAYFTSILQEAYTCGLLSDFDIENIQLQCVKFLGYKSEKYNGCDSSSLRVETAENIMKSNLYTVGLYLKSLSDAASAVNELKSTKIPELYCRGRAIINEKWHTTKRIYELVKSNQIITPNYTYNATLSDMGIGSFFRQYDGDYAAHEIPASIDYQLCNPVTDLTGIEFIQKYLENLLMENEFCNYFQAKKIHHLLYGYHEGYEDLLINIFEQVITEAVGCQLTHRTIRKLEITGKEIKHLNSELAKNNDQLIALKIRYAAEKMLQELQITSVQLRRYLEISLPKITSNIIQGVRTTTLDKVFIVPINPDLKPKIVFLSGVKMDDGEYRHLINELLVCRHSSDKLSLIKEKVRSFGDIEDVLFDAMLSKDEVASVLGMLGNEEIAALIKRHPYNSDIQAVDLSEAERVFRFYLKCYLDKLPKDRQEQIFEIVQYLDVENNESIMDVGIHY